MTVRRPGPAHAFRTYLAGLLAPLNWLMRCWSACAASPPPPQLVTLAELLGAGRGINLCLYLDSTK